MVGVILNLSIWFALHTVFGELNELRLGPMRMEVPVWPSLEPGAAALAIAALVAMLRFGLGLGWTLLGSALLGAIYWMVRSAA